MANPEHVEILKQGVEVWNRWRKENKKLIPDLSYANLVDTNLAGFNLSSSNLEFAGLMDSNLGNANLRGSNLINANLNGVKSSMIDLENANLSGTHLRKSSFRWGNLTNTTFTNADLYMSDFFYSSMKNINFKLSNLHGSRFKRTDLKGANFYRANLEFVDFQFANLTNASFMKSIFNGTKINETALINTIGLNEIVHKGPSSIGIDTIYLSNGSLPIEFLIGSGVPENFIQYMKSLTMNPFEYYSCFISYSHEDKPFARRLHDQLQTRGIRCWLDEHQILPGDDIYEQVDRGIRMWDKVLLCCSRHSLSSWWVDNEVATAFSKEQQLFKDRKKKVLSLIPLNLDGYMFSDEWSSGKRQQIKERLAADFTGWETDNTKFEEQFERVVKALQTEGAREDAPVSRL